MYGPAAPPNAIVNMVNCPPHMVVVPLIAPVGAGVTLTVVLADE